MNYTEKATQAGKVAEDILNGKSIERISENLNEAGYYQRDIDILLSSAKKVIINKYRPIVRAKLLAREKVKGSREFEKLDSDTLQKLIQQERGSIIAEEKKKVKVMLEDDVDPEEILNQINLDFYPKKEVMKQIEGYNEYAYISGINLSSTKLIRYSLTAITVGFFIIRTLEKSGLPSALLTLLFLLIVVGLESR